MIKINEIKEEKVYLYNPNDDLIGIITSELQFNDVRLQIVQQKLEGYYIVWNDQKYEINKIGHLIPNWPKGLYDINMNLLTNLIKTRVYN